MKEQLSTFIINREDRGVDPTTVVVESLKIGRSPERELLLNHPDVSRLHAGIKEIEGRFYLFSLSSSNSTTLNGRLVPVGTADALANGDEIRIGPFFLQIERKEDGLEINVTLQFGLRIGEAEARGEGAVERAARPQSIAGVVPTKAVAQALDLFWGKRTREKAGRRSPLHPLRPPRLGKARFNWTPTRDLVRPWPFSLFLWALIVLGGLSAVAAVAYSSAYMPDPVSNKHGLVSMSLNPPIAKTANAGSCTSCHALTGSMESRCESCHTTPAFVGTVTNVHEAAGISCVDCHTEHKGKDFRPMQLALMTCTKCHSDKNAKTYNGKSVHTPHGGTLGYPVQNNNWTWKGLSAEELAEKPHIAAIRKPEDTERQWLSMQFHALHIRRVVATSGLLGVDQVGGEANGPQVMSCSSCHKSFNPIDRTTPRETCANCHSGIADNSGVTVMTNVPNCISCHMQHVKDKRHWKPSLLVDWVRSTAGEK